MTSREARLPAAALDNQHAVEDLHAGLADRLIDCGLHQADDAIGVRRRANDIFITCVGPQSVCTRRAQTRFKSHRTLAQIIIGDVKTDVDLKQAARPEILDDCSGQRRKLDKRLSARCPL